MDDERITVTEAARLHGVARRTFSIWLDRGLIPYTTTVGGTRRLRRADVIAALPKATA